jgi:xylulose-5-phosphate/fructose-6-phosphate phosphoketolase
MIYLRDNPLLVEHLKKRFLGHWGSAPGQSFIWVQLNRMIKNTTLT